MLMVIDIPSVAGPVRAIHVPAGESSGTGPGAVSPRETVELYDLRQAQAGKYGANGRFIRYWLVESLWGLRGSVRLSDEESLDERSVNMLRDWVAWITYQRP